MSENSHFATNYFRQTRQRSESKAFSNLPNFQIQVQQNFLELGLSGLGIVAVSGGADSVALLRSLHPIAPILVAHYNHGLRHQESDQDAQFVERLGQELGLTVVCEKNISPLNSSDGVEAAARKARYEFLERTARRFQARWIATAHTADDQTETLVHRLIRGSGTQGLIGIPFVRELADDLRIIRPMLDRTRAEVLQYLEQIGQTFRHDSSNNSFDYTRNRIRHRLIPLLKEENPSIHRTFQKLATQIRELNEIEQWSAKQIYKQVKIQHKEDTLEISRGAFLDCPIAVIRSFWRYFWQKQNWPTAEMTFEHWQRLALACISGELSSTDFPGGIRVKATPKRIKIKRPPPHS